MTLGSLPHYILLPVWLFLRYRPRPSTSDERFLSDVLWGQFCLYLAFRIRDDLADNDADPGLLVFAPGLLELESIRVSSRHFPPSAQFWKFFFRSVETTVKGLVQSDAHERMQNASVRMLLKDYAKASAIFTVGAGAICSRYSRMRDFNRTVLFWREMAVAGQLLDDLADLEEDLCRHRFNSVVRIMLGRRLPEFARSNLALASVKMELMKGGLYRVAQMVLDRIDRAEKALLPIGGGIPYPGLIGYRESIEQMRWSAHRKSVQLLFSRVRGGQKKKPFKGKSPHGRSPR